MTADLAARLAAAEAERDRLRAAVEALADEYGQWGSGLQPALVPALVVRRLRTLLAVTGEGLTAAEVEALELADALAEAGVERGYVGGDAFRQAVARRLLASDWLTARTAQAEARGREAALREAADAVPTVPGCGGLATAAFLRARADLAAEVGGDGGGRC